jgi:pantetheine-phosphate adenylyltransferase
MHKNKIAIYPGTFDPVTNGHLDILRRGCDLFDEVVVAIAHNPLKDALFSVEERKEMICNALEEANLQECVSVKILEGLAVEGARKQKAIAILRGLRMVSDFEFEFQMALMNRHLAPELHTVYLMPKAEYIHLSSSIIKNVSRHGGEIEVFVPKCVLKKLREKFPS